MHEILIGVAGNIEKINLPTMIIGIGAILILILVKKINNKIPGPLIAVMIGMGLVYFMGLHEHGVKIVKDIPGGLPAFGIPKISGPVMSALLPIALTIAFVGFMESIAVAKAIQGKHKNYQVIPNQELIGLGMANIAGSFFKAFPVTGGFSRTAVNDQAGAKTGLASIISAVLIIFTLLFLTKYFYYLPNAVLAAIIMVAVFGLIDYKEGIHLWSHDKKDFWVFMVTAISTLSLGIEEGILVGVVLSLGMLIYKVSYPHIAELGRVPNSREYRNVERFENLEIYDDVLIVRFDAQLFFANASTLRDFIFEKLKIRPQIKHVIIEASAISHLDSSAIHMINDLVQEIHNGDREIYLSNVKGPVRDSLTKNGILHDDNVKHYYLSTRDAIKDIKLHQGHTFGEFVAQSDD